MDIVIRTVAIGVLGAILCLIIRRGAPEMGLVLTLLVSILIIAFVLQVVQTILGFLQTMFDVTNLSPQLLGVVLRTVGIGIATRLGADVCKDAGQSAIASAVEFAGCVAAIYLALPLLQAVFDMIGGFL